MRLSSSDIAQITDGTLTGNPDLPVSDIITDSRRFSFTEELIFFAITGKNHDGHSFIDSLYRKGVKVFAVERLPDDTGFYRDAAFIKTRNSIAALQLLATYHRKSYKWPVISVTGSTGKTIVKEWLSDVLGLSAAVIRSPRSYNSQVGVPLSVLKLDEKYKLAIFEAGISEPGEMEKLRAVIEPDIGVITNIGDAHNENFPDLETKAKEKMKLFVNTSMIIYCSDHEIIREQILTNKLFSGKRLVDWSCKNRKAGIYIKNRLLNEGATSLEVEFRNKKYDFKIPFSDRASVENAMTVTAVCLALETNPEIISKGLSTLVPVAMRMEIKAGINNCQLIEDYYNSDPGSLGMAIDYLKGQGEMETTLILSDFVQSGRDEKDLYGEVAGLVKKNRINRFIGIGPGLSGNRSLFDRESEFYFSTDEFIQRFKPSEFGDEIILLKGARKYEFERIGKLLGKKVHQTLLEINLDAIAHNLNQFRQCLDPGTRIMAMVKAFAYGAGPAEIASLLEYNRVSYLAVAYTDEGIELRNAGVTLPVMVMNPDPASLEQIIRYDLEPELYNFSSLKEFTDIASRHGLIDYPVHIKIDSGMHRLGFMPDDTDRLISCIKPSESVKIISLLSHFAASEEPGYDSFSHKQAEIFIKTAKKIIEAAGYPILRHICNSAGIVRFPQYQLDMVRVGIGLYGAGSIKGLTLKPAGRFKTRISQIKKVPQGEPVGYGCTDISDNERIIAILPVGYADGLNRKLGNGNGSLFVKGSRVPIVGNICMDMCMVDITGIDVKEGDEAEIFGGNITIDELAEKCQTIPYEILTSIPGRVKRVFFRE